MTRLNRCAALAVLLVGAAALPAARQHDAGVVSILAKATSYVAHYIPALSSIVSEERYEQRVRRKVERGAVPMDIAVEARTLVSDYLLVRVPGTNDLTPFRDVYSVDGTPVRDRNDRLLKLFVEGGTGALGRALKIREESARYNIGSAVRDINVPTFALEILGATLRDRFIFRERGRDSLDDLPVTVVEYEEAVRPTIILGQNDENLPATGRFWIHAESGLVLRTLLETKPRGMRTRIEVTYRIDTRLGMTVPERMDEVHEMGMETVTARSTYANFRRFRVDTAVEVK